LKHSKWPLRNTLFAYAPAQLT